MNYIEYKYIDYDTSKCTEELNKNISSPKYTFFLVL